jgi:CRP-like cAMP-binding protein
MKPKKNQSVDWEPVLAGIDQGKTTLKFGADMAIFHQGEPADAVFYLQQGKVNLTVTSELGKEVNVAVLGGGEFFGEGCLAGQPLRIATATALADTTVARIEKPLMVYLLHKEHTFSELFAAQLLSRNLRYEEDLIGHLFNSSEKRLARILLMLAHYGKESRSEKITPRITQETMAQMIGITRSRVGHFLSKFKRLGFIDYENNDGLTVHSGLLSVVLHDDDSAA